MLTLPDGNIIAVGAEWLRGPEVLVQPCFIYKEANGIRYTTFQPILKCEVDMRKGLQAGVVLSGGATMVQGSGVRMAKGRRHSLCRQ